MFYVKIFSMHKKIISNMLKIVEWEFSSEIFITLHGAVAWEDIHCSGDYFNHYLTERERD